MLDTPYVHMIVPSFNSVVCLEECGFIIIQLILAKEIFSKSQCFILIISLQGIPVLALSTHVGLASGTDGSASCATTPAPVGWASCASVPPSGAR